MNSDFVSFTPVLSTSSHFSTENLVYQRDAGLWLHWHLDRLLHVFNTITGKLVQRMIYEIVLNPVCNSVIIRLVDEMCKSVFSLAYRHIKYTEIVLILCININTLKLKQKSFTFSWTWHNKLKSIIYISNRLLKRLWHYVQIMLWQILHWNWFHSENKICADGLFVSWYLFICLIKLSIHPFFLIREKVIVMKSCKRTRRSICCCNE